jgi:hypothetical protein
MLDAVENTSALTMKRYVIVGFFVEWPNTSRIKSPHRILLQQSDSRMWSISTALTDSGHSEEIQRIWKEEKE